MSETNPHDNMSEVVTEYLGHRFKYGICLYCKASEKEIMELGGKCLQMPRPDAPSSMSKSPSPSNVLSTSTNEPEKIEQSGSFDFHKMASNMGFVGSSTSTEERRNNEQSAASSGSLPASRRYADAYVIANTVGMIGSIVKKIGIGLGLLVAVAGIGSGLANNSASLVFGGILCGVVVAVPIFVLGVLVSAQSQILKATLDTAVTNSPFLEKDDMARVMSL